MKKILAMLLALMMVLSLAACGGAEAAPEAEAPEADAPAEAPADFTGEELKFTTGGSQGTYYGFGSVLAGQITSSPDSTIISARSIARIFFIGFHPPDHYLFWARWAHQNTITQQF